MFFKSCLQEEENNKTLNISKKPKQSNDEDVPNIISKLNEARANGYLLDFLIMLLQSLNTIVSLF